MNNANGGNVIYHFKGDSKDLDSKVSKVASGVKSAFKVAGVAVAAATTAVAGFVGASVKGFAEFEQLEGGLESLFGKGSEEMNSIIKSSEQAYKDLTMSQNEYLNAFEGSYSLVKNGMADETKAIEYTNKVLQLSSDLFNTYGGSTEYYQNAIDWALKGTYSYLDNLNIGIKGTQEGFIEAANSSGILGRTIKDVSELTNEEIVDVIQHYAEAAGAWGKTQEEAGKTIQGSLKMTKAAWSNFVTGFSKDGSDMGKLTEELVNSAVTFLNNLFPVIERALTAISDALPNVVEKIGSILPGLLQRILPSLINGAVSLLNSLGKSLPSLLQQILPSFINGIISILKSLGKALPSLIPVLMDGIMQGIKGLAKILPQLTRSIIQGIVLIVQSIAEELPTLLPIIVDAILGIIPILLENAPLILKTAVQLAVAIVKAVLNVIVQLGQKLFSLLGEIGSKLFNNIGSFCSNIFNTIKTFISNIPYYIGYIIGNIVGAIYKFVTVDIPNFVNGIITWLSELPGKIKTIIDNIINWVKSLPGKIISFVVSIKDAVVNTIKELPGKMLDIGKNIVQGIWKGIQNAKNWVISKVKQFAKGILDGIKNALGIHSPSTEFAILGKFSVLGYTKGLEGMKSEVQDTIDSMFNLQPNISGAMSSTYSPNMVVNVQNNMELDPLGQVVNRVKTFSGGAKNDYNWGAGL